MQTFHPPNEVRSVNYAPKTAQGKRNLVAVEDVLRNAFPGDTRSSGVAENREGDGLHLIITIRMREAST